MSVYNNPRPGAFVALTVGIIVVNLVVWLGLIAAAVYVIKAVWSA